MKKLILILATVLLANNINIAQTDKPLREKFGKTINLSIGAGYYGYGIGYYSYVRNPTPVLNLNFEFDIFRNFTLAPFISGSTYQNRYFWGDPNKPNSDNSYHYYNYNEIIIPVGVKGTYYFDELFHANEKWDFYAAASVGFIYRNVVWDSGYYGDRTVYQSSSALYIAAHVGAEYHMNKKVGLFLDLSTGVSSLGFAFHL